MKLESLVIADQHAAVNMYPGPVHTARHTLGIGFARSIGPRITNPNPPHHYRWRPPPPPLSLSPLLSIVGGALLSIVGGGGGGGPYSQL